MISPLSSAVSRGEFVDLAWTQPIERVLFENFDSAAVHDFRVVLDNPMVVVGSQTNASNGVHPNPLRRSLPYWAGQEGGGGECGEWEPTIKN